MKKNNSRPSSRNSSSQRPAQGRPHSGGRSQQGRGSTPAQRSENYIPREWRIVIGTHAIMEVLNVRPHQVKELLVAPSLGEFQ